jgi:hypothetical protein
LFSGGGALAAALRASRVFSAFALALLWSRSFDKADVERDGGGAEAAGALPKEPKALFGAVAGGDAGAPAGGLAANEPNDLFFGAPLAVLLFCEEKPLLYEGEDGVVRALLLRGSNKASNIAIFNDFILI